jgi:hypothetical protein
MLHVIRIGLFAAFVLGAVVNAFAATNHGQAARRHPSEYDWVPFFSGGYCPPSGGPACSNACLPVGPPCRRPRDDW